VKSRFVLLFMTDGQGSGPGTLITDYARQYPSRFMMHSVGFGSSVDQAKMQSLTAGGGKYQHTLTSSELLRAFVNIASHNKIMDTTVTRLVLGYL
jgi:hypothetical protein